MLYDRDDRAKLQRKKRSFDWWPLNDRSRITGRLAEIFMESGQLGDRLGSLFVRHSL